VARHGLEDAGDAVAIPGKEAPFAASWSGMDTADVHVPKRQRGEGRKERRTMTSRRQEWARRRDELDGARASRRRLLLAIDARQGLNARADGTQTKPGAVGPSDPRYGPSDPRYAYLTQSHD
jgi:hypothetical protein